MNKFLIIFALCLCGCSQSIPTGANVTVYDRSGVILAPLSFGRYRVRYKQDVSIANPIKLGPKTIQVSIDFIDVFYSDEINYTPPQD
jgi:hypothetical protein